MEAAINKKQKEPSQENIIKTACFIGQEQINRSSISNLASKVEKTIDTLIKQGIIFFGCGGSLLFHQLCGLAILNAKKENPDIKLIIVLPCRTQESLFGGASTNTYKLLKEKADKIVYTAEKYSNDCIKKRGLHFIKYSSVCVAYVKHINSDAGHIVRLARERGLTIMDLTEN